MSAIRRNLLPEQDHSGSERQDRADAVLVVHQVEAVVDLVQADPVEEQRLDVEWPASQRSTRSGTWVRPLTPPNDEPVTRRPVIRNRGTISSVSPLPSTPHIVARPQASRADSTACRITATRPVASNV